MKIVTAAEMRAAEERVIAAGTAASTLMDRAARSVSDAIATTPQPAGPRQVAILVGRGNNGGDGIVTALYRVIAGDRVIVGLPADRSFAVFKSDDTRDLWNELVRRGSVTLLSDLEAFREACSTADVLVDALLGTGVSRAVGDDLRPWLDCLAGRKAGSTLIAVDLPSGVFTDTGEADDASPTADVTVTFGAPKRGHYLFPGAARAGRLVVADIGLGEDAFDASRVSLLDATVAAPLLPARPANGHKGTFGSVLIIGGSRRFPGASSLSAMAAVRSGAGLVTVATTEQVYRVIAARIAEPTWLPLPENDDGSIDERAVSQVREVLGSYDAVVLGPGLGSAAKAFVRSLLPEVRVPLVLDADGLNAIAPLDRMLPLSGAILTPHPGEMARLLGRTGSVPEGDRFDVVSSMAQRGYTVVLKGAHTLVATGNDVGLSGWSNPALATGGTGDVLAGVIGGLLAQGVPSPDAARLGVALHATAADLWRAENGDAGLAASDLIDRLPLARRQFVSLRTI